MGRERRVYSFENEAVRGALAEDIAADGLATNARAAGVKSEATIATVADAGLAWRLTAYPIAVVMSVWICAWVSAVL
jgi:hypothetical protein